MLPAQVLLICDQASLASPISSKLASAGFVLISPADLDPQPAIILASLSPAPDDPATLLQRYPGVPLVLMITPDQETDALQTLEQNAGSNYTATDYVFLDRPGRLVPLLKRLVHQAQSPDLARAAPGFGISEAEKTNRRVSPRRRSDLLAELSQALVQAGLDYQGVLDMISRRAAELLGDASILSLLYENGQSFELSSLYHADHQMREILRSQFREIFRRTGQSLYSRVVTRDQPLLIDRFGSFDLDPHFHPQDYADLQKLGVSGLMMVPLKVQGAPIGLLVVTRHDPDHPFTAEDLAFLQNLADRAALAISNARLYRANLLQKEELELTVARRTAEITIVNQYLQMELAERRRVEAALRIKDDAIESSLSAIALANLDGCLTYVNPYFMQAWGFEQMDEVIGRPIADFWESPQEAAQVIVELGQAGRFVGELSARRRDGELFPVQVTASRVKDPDGSPVGIMASFLDITERRQSEKAIHHSAATLRALLDAIPESALLMSPDGGVINANQAAADQMDARIADLIGANYFGLSPADLARSHRKFLNRVVETHQPVFFEDLRFGRIIDSSIYPVFDADGEVASLAVLGQDVTERRQIEVSIARSEARFRSLFENAPIGIAILRDGITLLVNQAYARMFGGAPLELEGRPLLERIAPRQRAGVAELNCWLATGGTQADAFETTCQRLDLREFPCFVQVGQIDLTDGPAVVTFITDITERKQAEAALEVRTEALARSNADLEQFAYIASHDLQEPLRMITSYLQLLSRRYAGRLGTDADEFIAYAVDGAVRMQRLIQDLLAYSRVGTRSRPPAPVNTGQALEAALHSLQVAIAERQALVTHDLLPVVPADETQLIQLFQNLVGNAIKFQSDQPPRVHVSAALLEAHDSPLGRPEWVFSVRDNGIGIDPQYFERIFVIFQRLHHRDRYPGTGIGLAICKKIIERQGGRIWVESVPGHGATFFFTLLAS